MTTDRELLELAAKAAGITGDLDNIISGWNPLTDDGDALRLAVKLGLSVIFGANYVICGEEQTPTVNNAGDPYAATRHTIACAAAAIGKEMK